MMTHTDARITELEAENEKLRERLLERNNVHRRLVKMRSALERITKIEVPAWDDDRAYGAGCDMKEIARQALEEENR